MSKRPGARPVTLTDVARRAGVSVPAASRVLNGGVRGSESGSPELRRRVKEAARELGYSVSTAAQAIKDGRARTIALIVNDIDDFGSATMITGFMHAAEKRGVSVAVRATHDDPQHEVELLTRLRGERHRAVVFATSRTTDAGREAALAEQLHTLHRQGARIVVVGDNQFDYPRVTVDHRQAAADLSRGLVGLGHRNFAVVAGPEDQLTSRDRLDGFVEGLADHGITPAEVIHEEFTRDGGFHAVSRLRSRVQELDVIAALSDAIAVGVIAALHECGLRVPDDVVVTGFDLIPLLRDLVPGFSTVKVPLEAFGEAALGLALDGPPGAEDKQVVALHAYPIIDGQPLDVRPS
ncbi:LacI family DNA-binding transcriptional regulator [Streptomyces shenzhenensis]|uniref:LacI family DNA-binding transcriptional regulator n=1 Tax=Streptomyces shenzhenensis TaxID=943815 RepID=UPI0015F0BA20|nr:LacI family DNA-binding transcriptional regulator [Streptomyces shenzhenensis]